MPVESAQRRVQISFSTPAGEDNHWQQLDFLRNVATHLRHESLQLHVVGLKLLCHVVNLHAGAAFRSADYEDAQRVVSAAQQEAV